ncbi:hypothetical protein KY285_000643 [Solanum tuberosum]|nr:hypothetical protein KY285_000643 [Solanum tuberosum]
MPSESPPIMNHDGEIGHLLAYSARTTITSTAATKLIRSRGRRRCFVEANRRKSKRKVGCLWGAAIRPRIGGGNALDPPCLQK